jgi:hypothetical protein
MWVTNYGSFAWDILTGNSGLVYPKGTTKTAVFASGLWLGAAVGPGAGTEVRIALAEYSQEYGPGKMVGGLPDNPNRANYQVYKVIRFTGDPNDTTHVDRSGDYPEDPLVHHSWSEYMSGAVPYGAPWKTYRLAYTDIVAPADTDSVNVPGPDVLGDQMLWCVYNDADGTLHTNSAGQTSPLGVEVQQTTFAFDRQGALGNTVFAKFKIINAGADTLKNMFASLWSDPDLGGASDDLVGCDTTLSLGYCYNATNNDEQYGAAPPAVGYDFFLGPVNAAGDPLPLTSFNKYINGTDPGSFDETYNYMQGLQPDGTDLTDPQTGLVTTFYHPGNPVTGSGWLDSNPADRRFLMNSGPFTMAPGAVQEVVGAIIIGQGKNRLSSIASLKFFDSFAQAAFDSSFDLPSPPAQPQVDVATDHGKVVLSWDNASRTDYDEPGYAFEGYNVYQGASISGPWTLLATYDETTSPAVVFDEVFDVETGQVIPQFPTAFGSNLGVRFTHTITQDAVRGGNLRDGTEYFFAVTSYSHNAAGKPKVLENSQAVLRVIPQRGAAGTDYATASATDVTYSQGDPSKSPSTNVVTVEVVNPSLVTGHSYKVDFVPLTPPFFGQIGQDTATVRYAWNLTDVTTSLPVLTQQLNQRGDDDYRVEDGIRVNVDGAYFPQLQSVTHRNLNTDNRRAITAASNWSGNQDWFFGGAGYANDFFPGTSTLDHTVVPDSFTTVEMRFSTTATQQAYRYLRFQLGDSTSVGPIGDPPPGGREYAYAGFRTVPFTVWDVVNNVQLDVAYAEACYKDSAGTIMPPAKQPATFDSTWAPSVGDGGREYLFILKSPYTATPKAAYEVDGNFVSGDQPQLYALWAALRDAADIIDDGDRLDFTWAVPATPNDSYTFSTDSLVRNNATVARTKLSRIRAVPNPYYNRSRYELSQFSRVIRFMNLPETCTIRIFNLAGELVRTLQKTDITTSVLTWDLQTERQLPVASGVYVYHVDAGAAGTTFGRVVVFMEKERLNNF